MFATASQLLHWTATGLKESAAMVWMTWWPLVLGFTLSGTVQSFLPRDGGQGLFTGRHLVVVQLRGQRHGPSPRRAGRLVPTTRNTAAISGHFSLGWTLALNIVATLVLVTLWLTARRGGEVARDPICGMTVDISAPVAVLQLEGRSVYFCSLRCAERFDLTRPMESATTARPTTRLTRSVSCGSAHATR